MIRPLYFFLLSVLILISTPVLSQDPHFSMFFANPVYLNPAFAGFGQGTAVTMNYHEQWPGIPDGDLTSSGTSYRTVNATVDYQLPCFLHSCKSKVGFALSAFQDAAGQAPLKTFGLSLAGSYGYRFNHCMSDNFSELRFGWQFGMMHKNLDYNYLIYSDQLNPYYGLIGDPSEIDISSPIYFNNNTGILFQTVRNQYENFTAGFSSSNIFEPDQALREGENAPLPRRFTAHMGANVYMGHVGRVVKNIPMYLTPQFRWDFQAQNSLHLLSGGAYVQSSRIYAGLFLQGNFGNFKPTANTFPDPKFSRGILNLSISGGIDLYQTLKGIDSWSQGGRRLILGLTYDASLSRISNGNTLGGIEINLRMTFWGDPSNTCNNLPLDVKKCPVLQR